MNFPKTSKALVEALDAIVASSKGQLTDEQYAAIDLAAQVIESVPDKDVLNALDKVKENWRPW